MPFNLTGSSPIFSAAGAGKFDRSLTGGTAISSAPVVTNGTFTAAGWVKTTAFSLSVAFGQNQAFWIGVSSGNLAAHYGGTAEVALNSTTRIDNGAWHHVELDVSAAGGKLFCDGVLVASSATTMAAAGAIYTNNFELRSLTGAYLWSGEIDEVAVYNTALNSTAFTPPTAPAGNSDAGLIALWHLDNDLLDSTGSAATAVSMTGPASGTTGVASTNFTVGANGAITGTVVVTPSDGGGGGTFTPSTVSISSGTPTGTFTYTPASNGAKTISVTNNGSLTNPTSITYTASSAAATATTLSGPTSGVAGVASTSFTVGANGAITGTVIITPSDAGAGGTFAPTTVSISSATPTGTFVYTPSSAGAKTISTSNNGALTNPSTITYTASAGPNNALSAATANVLFSPYNWDVQASTAKTINAGAYFKTIFGGTTCTLQFDMTGIAAPLPQISYRVDRFGPWISVPIAASVTITIPSDTADYASKPGHLLEVLVKSMTETQARWSTQATAVKLTGIMLDTGKTLTAPPALPRKAIFYGDSITEGVRTVNMTATNDTDRNDAGQSWSIEVGRILGAEVGNVGFGASGFIATGSGGVPILPTSYNLLYAGVARSFAVSPDFIVLMEGTNDSGDVTANATTVLNALLAATTGTKIIILRPFNGTTHATQLQAAIAACTAPARCTYVDTAGFFTTANSSDNLHPYGVENITHIAPLVADAVRSILAGAPSLATRTVTVTLGDANGPAANMTGLKVAFHDDASPDLFTTARYKSATGTTNATGVLTFSFGSTLAAGANGHLTVLGAAGVHYNGPAAVA